MLSGFGFDWVFGAVALLPLLACMSELDRVLLLLVMSKVCVLGKLLPLCWLWWSAVRMTVFVVENNPEPRLPPSALCSISFIRTY